MKAVSVIAKICLLLALIAFVMPFVTISCDSEDIATYNGIEMASGRSFSSEKNSSDAPDTETPNPFLIGAAIAAVVALVLSFGGSMGQKLASAVISLIGAGLLVLFRATFVDMYLGEYQDVPLKIIFRFGWSVSLICFLAAAFALIAVAVSSRPSSPNQMYDMSSPMPPPMQ